MADPDPAESDQASRAPPKQHDGSQRCFACLSPPAPGSKLRHCGRCRSATYCSKSCAQTGWAEHKVVCGSVRRVRDEALAAYQARGGSKSNFYQDLDAGNIAGWLRSVPGLGAQVNLLAWTNRGESPVIHVSASRSDVAGSAIQVTMEPRSCWDIDVRNRAGCSREELRETFGAMSFRPDEQYVLDVLMREQEGKEPTSYKMTFFFTGMVSTVHVIEIVEALTAATRAEDLSNAFAWFVDNFPSSQAQDTLQYFRQRATKLLGGVTALPNSVPVPSRALNNEVAHMMMTSFDLEFAVRLTGLVSAAHLNGREGIICHQIPGGLRWKVRLDDGTCVDVLAVKFMHIQGNYKRKSPLVL
uniref:MYND-type domain-containing protein n=1 Tax=Mantoniella antarctica TaxID=81844 RepID=A0A7S0T538_9CHLO|mmetsp:Transcript_8009/g.19845  ORF Transcript_8009/g.19845 Transcript_8009/m.19845 type:complete len:357 (+) Transcript_8009:389-1459(+)|eukprot:CAMPEP_0181358784 /NCGR_PEP_ID=MMETSP1106-20121128/5714_1 /TAXON_ID=81844 /ORGANISM="Mantoniella antarctica, Strain SL-175" /LENGTH=356 /DNA_ID=CAMNT_0023471807 /DNA_START=170 /DNA_END=1240 /DNA_ORIENTATION=-